MIVLRESVRSGGSRKGAGGFSLVELLLVVTCILVLVLMISYGIVVAQEKARIAVCATNLRGVHQAATAYAMDSNGWYPLHGTAAADSANVPVFTGGSGNWIGSAQYPGPFWGAGNYKFGGIAQALVNAGARFQDASTNTQAIPGNVYLGNWKALYCPNQLEGPYFMTEIYGGFDMLDGNDMNSYTVVKNVTGDISAYYGIPVNRRKASDLPTIGYCAPNGNSPGYSEVDPNNPANLSVNNSMPRYKGRKVVKANGTASWGGDHFAAGFMNDPPDTILIADNSKFSGTTTLKILTGRSSRSDYLVVNHESGMNTAYNDGRVVFVKFPKDEVPSSSVYKDDRVIFGFR